MSENNTYKAFWDEALKQIHEEYRQNGNEVEFSLWFNMEYLGDSQSEIEVSVPSDFMWNQMVTRGNVALVEEKLENLTGLKIKIKSSIKNKTISVKTDPVSDTSMEQTVSKTVPESVSIEENTDYESDTIKSAEKASNKTHPNLSEEFTFEKFVPGDNSKFGYDVSLAAAKEPGTKYNPILIYGGVGLGKTHLMQSIGNYIYATKGSKVKICYTTAENLMNEFTKGIRNKGMDKFKDYYRKVDVLLVDDIQFLNNKEGFQEEFFHTFEALSQLKSQMVFTCDRPIKECKGIDERLSTRFTKGISLDLTAPNYETRIAIIQKKLEINGKSIPEDVIEFIAKNVETNVRDLESCITKVTAYSELTGTINVEKAKDLLRDIFTQASPGSITIDSVQKVVADHFNISLSDLKGKKRNKSVVFPRQIAIYLARVLGDYSFPDLGIEFGGRDHTTAMHSYNLVEDALKADESLRSTIELLKREIKDYKK